MKNWQFKSAVSLDFQKRVGEEISSHIKDRKQKGMYHSYPEIHDVLQKELENIRDAALFLKHASEVLQYSWAIDIADFEIPAKKGLRGKIKHAFQKVVWKILKFNTFHLWVQQREFNAMLRSCMLLLLKKWTQKEKDMTRRILKLQRNRHGH